MSVSNVNVIMTKRTYRIVFVAVGDLNLVEKALIDDQRCKLIMISIVAEVFNSFAIVIQNAFILTSFVGKLIVATITGTANAIIKVFENVMLFFQILYEDNMQLFSEEIPGYCNHATESFTNQVIYGLHGVSTTYIDITHKLSSVLGSVKWLTDFIWTILADGLILFKNITIFMGSTLWLIITFFPIHLPQLLQACFRYVMNIVVDFIIYVYSYMLKCTNFMSDVPLESFIGITSAIIIVRLCVHFQATIFSHIVEMYWSLVRKLLYIYYTLYNYVTDSEVRVIAHMASGQDLETRTASLSAIEDEDENSGADTLCIICQERQKCVLTLPCRHVCLCAECCRRLYGYQRTCPICRTFIYHSVTIYL